ncbi:EF-hand calcium-binding domain-containing protein 1-like [Lingula anatina]|uniref:EF-hand calcium-binding domain-containing protein 1-like n=1 Tax=Lingula anatina TaxID=7574 RepID=A0A1S3HIA3_LINAN|nr:EF-hand calcium-binding domain-containing protein 1-like [Lingula anatina]|eukprot:XP_013384729.1 EF-hand calcium-binding domain-containing protein 1-like [Lingula anatina]
MKVFILLVACVAYASAGICEDVCSPLCKTGATAAGAAISGGTAAAAAGAAGTVVCGPSCSTVCDLGGKVVDWVGGLFGKRDLNEGWVTVRTWESVFPRAFSAYDTNKDGLISHREFVNAISAEVRDLQTLRVFKMADLDGDDHISPAELRAAPFRFGP